MDWSDTMQTLLVAGGGAVTLKAMEYAWSLLTGFLGRRRTELDKLGRDLALAMAERDRQALLKQKAVELYYRLRLMMIKSGHWTDDQLPDLDDE